MRDHIHGFGQFKIGLSNDWKLLIEPNRRNFKRQKQKQESTATTPKFKSLRAFSLVQILRYYKWWDHAIIWTSFVRSALFIICLISSFWQLTIEQKQYVYKYHIIRMEKEENTDILVAIKCDNSNKYNKPNLNLLQPNFVPDRTMGQRIRFKSVSFFRTI